MEINFRISDGCGTTVKEFRINGIEAEISDFGLLHIDHMGTWCNYCFDTICANGIVKAKYNLDDEEIENVLAILESRLTGSCGMCE